MSYPADGWEPYQDPDGCGGESRHPDCIWNVCNLKQLLKPPTEAKVKSDRVTMSAKRRSPECLFVARERRLGKTLQWLTAAKNWLRCFRNSRSTAAGNCKPQRRNMRDKSRVDWNSLKIASVYWNVMNEKRPPSSREGWDSGGSGESHTLLVKAHGRKNRVLKTLRLLTSFRWMLVAECDGIHQPSPTTLSP